jgi:uncharacterized membrane protein
MGCLRFVAALLALLAGLVLIDVISPSSAGWALVFGVVGLILGFWRALRKEHASD